MTTYTVFGDGFYWRAATDLDDALRRLSNSGYTAVVVPGERRKNLPIADGAPVAEAVVYNGKVRRIKRQAQHTDVWGIRDRYGCGTRLVPPRSLNEHNWREELERALVDAMRAFAGPGEWNYEVTEWTTGSLVLRSTNLPDGWTIEAVWAMRTPLDPPVGPALFLERPPGMASSIYESGICTAVRWLARRQLEQSTPEE